MSWPRAVASQQSGEPSEAAAAALATLTLARPLIKRLPWPIRSVLGGTGGTAALTLAYAVEHRLHPEAKGPLDYDDSLVPGQIVVSILELSHVSAREEGELGLLLRWSYGSAFGLWLGLLRRRISDPWATVAFGATLITVTLTMFPLLGRTPPPWRWPRGYLATSLATHATYVIVCSTLSSAG